MWDILYTLAKIVLLIYAIYNFWKVNKSKPVNENMYHGVVAIWCLMLVLN